MIELARPRQRTLGIEILIQTTKGLANVEAIAARGQAARIELNATYTANTLTCQIADELT